MVGHVFPVVTCLELKGFTLGYFMDSSFCYFQGNYEVKDFGKSLIYGSVPERVSRGRTNPVVFRLYIRSTSVSPTFSLSCQNPFIRKNERIFEKLTIFSSTGLWGISKRPT